jgi:adenylate cyclase class 2
MGTEIEAKLKVNSLQQAAAKLDELGAEFLQEQLQKDYYFDDAGRAFTKADKCLRLRQQFASGEERIFLTYKGAKEKDNFKKRQEAEVEVKNFDSVGKLLSALGFKQVLIVEKKRRIWRLGKCKICLDDLPLLGSFVEIEGPDDSSITDVQRSLSLADLPHIPEGYASLMRAKLHQRQVCNARFTRHKTRKNEA